MKTHLTNWRITKAIDDKKGGFYIRATDSHGADYPIAVTRAGDEKSNAEFIALACNSHDALIEACRGTPALLEACKYAAELIPVARRYFPKSIQNRDSFCLENACATLNKAILQAVDNRAPGSKLCADCNADHVAVLAL